MNLYPAIDLIDGSCVRLTRGDFDEVTRYATDPCEVARGYAAAGAEYLHIVDLDGAREGGTRQVELVSRLIRASGLRAQVGGGIRTVAQARAWLEAGAERVVVGSLAVKEPALAQQLVEACGPDRITLALDVKFDGGTPWVATHGWKQTSELSLWTALQNFEEWKLSHLLCTDISRDGMLEGPNFDLYQEILTRFPTWRLQASGGVSGLEDLRRLRELGVPACIVGKALYEKRFTLAEALKC